MAAKAKEIKYDQSVQKERKTEDGYFTKEEIAAIKQKALSQGFFNVSFIELREPSEGFQEFYRLYLGKKFQASMKYLENTQAKFSAQKIFMGAKSLAVFSLSYFHRHYPFSGPAAKKSRYSIARFAAGADYHVTINQLLKDIVHEYGPGRLVCDSTPFPERYYARQAQAGFIGKNSMLIDPDHGSYFFLAFALFKKRLPEDPGLKDYGPGISQDIQKYCGNCERCVKACPGGALDGSGQLDSRRCYSYWSIENKTTEIGHRFKKMNSIFGCDICQEVCPYNDVEKLPEGKTGILPVSEKIANGQLQNSDLKDTSFERAGIAGLERNLAFLKSQGQSQS